MSSDSLVGSLGRNRYACAVAGSLLIASMTLVVAPSAFAIGGCTSLTPALETTDTCAGGSTYTVTPPAGATSVSVNVSGGGGGHSSGSVANTKGGNGARVIGEITLLAPTALTVRVGSGGLFGGFGSPGGQGGFLSSVSIAGSVLVIAGGGGGGGTQSQGGNGGLVGVAGADYSDYDGDVTGGLGGAAGVGGGGGTATDASGAYPGSPGADWSAGGAGGAGGFQSSTLGSGGGGGGGYGGGGGGGYTELPSSAGGGGGGSFVAPNLVSGVTIDSTGGIGGAGADNPGGQGGMVLVFHRAAPTMTSVSPASGSTAGGGTVLITGAHFAGATAVTVGGMPCASFTVVSATQISCVLPAGVAGAADVTVSAPGGTATLAAGFRYAGVPTAPVSLAASPGASSLALSFGVPASDGGSPITGYQVSTDGGTTWATLTSGTTGSSVTATVAGLHAGAAYSVRVRAVNGIGAGPASAVVNATVGSAVPSAPAAPVAVAGVASATVTWPVSTSGGVTGYVVSAHPGPSTCTTSSVSANSCLMGLAAGVKYRFTVVARNAGGSSADSAMSNEVTPSAPAVPVTAPIDAPTTLTTTDGILLKVEPAQPVTVVGTGFAAYSTARVIIYSTPVLLATVTTDGKGDFRAPVIVPSDLEVGGHNFVASGIDPQGRTRQLRMPVTITAAAYAVRAPLRLHVTAGDRSLTVSFNRAIAPAGTRIRGYQISLDGGRHWATVHPAGRNRLHVTLTGLRAGVTYRVRVRAVTSFGRHASTSLVSRSVPGKPFGPWFHDPISLTGRRNEATVPVDPAGYHGGSGFTAANYRSYNGSIAVPASWTKGHHLLPGEAATLTGDGLFDFDSAVITPAGMAQLRILAPSLRGDRSVTCEGYTDYAGAAAHELDLSARRALAICSTLVTMGAKVTVHTVGYGDARPVTIGGTAQSRAANRRVVVLVTS